MAQLMVFRVDSPETAEKILDLAVDLDRQELLELADAAWVERRPDGKVPLHHSINLPLPTPRAARQPELCGAR